MKRIPGIIMTIALIVVIAGCSSSGGKAIKSANIGTLKYVPAGSFQRDEDPANVSTVGAFYIAQNEVTWEQFVKVTKLAKPAYTDVQKFAQGTTAPATTLTWYHGIVFCNMLSMLEGLTPVYTISGDTDPAKWGVIPQNVSEEWDAVTEDIKANGYRLPTEMEWEWAAMGAVDGANGYQKAFAGSDKLNNVGDYAWIIDNSDKMVHKIGTKKPNELGLYDMSGNADEWCWDWKAEYPSGALDNATFRGAKNGGEYGQRVNRGGCFYSAAYDVTVSRRGGNFPNYNDVFVGLRVVRY